VDAIVNAANSRLRHGGGVAGAIVRRGGPTVQEESDRIAPVPTGSAGITVAGRLPCRFVIHAVGPVWTGGIRGEEGLLESAIRAALDLAIRHGLRSLSIPAVSAGIFGFPADRAVRTIVAAVTSCLDANPDAPVREVRFCSLDPDMARRFASALGLSEVS